MVAVFLLGALTTISGFIIGFVVALLYCGYGKTRKEYYEEYLKRHDLS